MTSGFRLSRASIGTCMAALRNDVDHGCGSGQPVNRREAEEFGVARDRIGLPLVAVGRRWWRGVGRVGVDGGEDLGTGHAIDCRVVHTQEHRHRSFGHVADPVEPVDQVQLPRGTAEVERSGMDAGDLRAELTPAARPRQGDLAHVVLEVEVAVADPVRAGRGRTARSGSVRGSSRRRGDDPRCRRARRRSSVDRRHTSTCRRSRPCRSCCGRVANRSPPWSSRTWTVVAWFPLCLRLLGAR